MQLIKEKLNGLFPQMVAWRRHLHRNPELSFHEYNTAEMVSNILEEWGLEVHRNVGGNGVVALLKGGQEGPTVALRADMDALPIQDQKTCEYASTVPGVMHACGHDAHTATLLAVAQVLNGLKQQLKGNVKFIFQHAEELSPGGAASMIEAGALQGVDAIYGVHLFSTLQLGEVHTRAGGIMAAADEFNIEIHGKGGHAGMPHEAVDSIVVGSQLVVQLQSLVSRQVNPLEPLVISIGAFQSGNSYNVIAETALLKGTVRSFDEDMRLTAKQQVEHFAAQVCQLYGAHYTLDYRLGYPPVINHEQETERVFRVAAKQFGSSNVIETPQMMAGEDFAYYLQHVPGCFIFVGANNPAVGASYPHHHPRFDIDESAMLQAAELLVELALDVMNGNN